MHDSLFSFRESGLGIFTRALNRRVTGDPLTSDLCNASLLCSDLTPSWTAHQHKSSTLLLTPGENLHHSLPEKWLINYQLMNSRSVSLQTAPFIVGQINCSLTLPLESSFRLRPFLSAGTWIPTTKKLLLLLIPPEGMSCKALRKLYPEWRGLRLLYSWLGFRLEIRKRKNQTQSWRLCLLGSCRLIRRYQSRVSLWAHLHALMISVLADPCYAWSYVVSSMHPFRKTNIVLI